jgi:hypothetical protein
MLSLLMKEFYGEVGIGLLAKVMRGLRYDGDWLPPTRIVTLLVSLIKHASEVLTFCWPSAGLLLTFSLLPTFTSYS